MLVSSQITTFSLKFQVNKWENSAAGRGEQRHVFGLVAVLWMEKHGLVLVSALAKVSEICLLPSLMPFTCGVWTFAFQSVVSGCALAK